MNCTLCETVLNKRADEVYYICDGCGAYVKDKSLYFSNVQEKEHYEQHNNDVNDIGYQKFTSPVTNQILACCTPEMLGLDFGCGEGPVITKQLRDKGYQVNLYDPFFYPNPTYVDFKYDYIFSCEVFEHFYNPMKEISKLYSLLKPNGYLIIMTHLYNNQQDFEKWYYRKDLTHVFIYTFQTIEFIANSFGFEVIKQSERLVVLRKIK